MTNKTALITGATSGFGVEIAKNLVKNGYSLFVLGRSQEKLKALQCVLNEVNPTCNIELIKCDLSSLQSVVESCEEVRSKCEQINLLVLNAGLWNFEFKTSKDQIEETLQVNLIAPTLIFKRLRSLLPTDNSSKVIFTSSGLHQGTIYYEDIEFRKRFSGFKSYRQSKLGILLITRLFALKPAYSGISFYCVHPGVVNTKLGRNAGWFANLFFKLIGKSPKKGARTHIHLIKEPTSKLSSGGYYANCRMVKTTRQSYDMEMAERLEQLIQNYIDTRSAKPESV